MCEVAPMGPMERVSYPEAAAAARGAQGGCLVSAGDVEATVGVRKPEEKAERAATVALREQVVEAVEEEGHAGGCQSKNKSSTQFCGEQTGKKNTISTAGRKEGRQEERNNGLA